MDVECIKILRSEIIKYINAAVKWPWIRFDLVLLQEQLEAAYIQQLDKISDPLIKAKEIKEMILVCDSAPKLNTCFRLKRALTNKQYELSKLI